MVRETREERRDRLYQMMECDMESVNKDLYTEEEYSMIMQSIEWNYDELMEDDEEFNSINFF